MSKYFLRFGLIPADETSRNYRATTFNDQEMGKFKKENGVSVFALDTEGNPILDNEKLLISFLIRFCERKEPCFLVSGDEVGTGADEEPLLKNVKINTELKNWNFLNFIFKTLKSNGFKFDNFKGDRENKFYDFYYPETSYQVRKFEFIK